MVEEEIDWKVSQDSPSIFKSRKGERQTNLKVCMIIICTHTLLPTRIL